MVSDNIFLETNFGWGDDLNTLEKALKNPTFTDDDCSYLDMIARDFTQPHAALSQIDLQLLGARLSVYRLEYSRHFGRDDLSPIMKRDRLRRLKKLTGKLISEFGIDDQPDILPDLVHWNEGGIFHESKYKPTLLLRALLILDQEADRALSSFADVKPQRGKRPQPRRDRLLMRLAYEYGKTWGGNHITASRKDGNAGPSVRFIRHAIYRITRVLSDHQNIYDLLRPKISETNTALAVNDPFYDQIFQECEAFRVGESSSE